jgi:hypothetical protein
LSATATTSGFAPGDGELTTEGLGGATEGSADATAAGEALGDDEPVAAGGGVLLPLQAVSASSSPSIIRTRIAAP